MINNGKGLIENLFDLEEIQKHDESGLLKAKIIWTASICSNPYLLQFSLHCLAFHTQFQMHQL